MLDKKNEGDHKAANASHPGDEAKKSKEMDAPSCAKADTYSITRAECPGEDEGRFLRVGLERCLYPNSPPTDTVTMANMSDFSLPKLSETLR